MKHLLDVNVLLASVWITHPQHATATAWLAGKTVVVCPISELGFLRISTHKKAFNFTMADARTGLENFLNERSATRIPTIYLHWTPNQPCPSKSPIITWRISQRSTG